MRSVASWSHHSPLSNQGAVGLLSKYILRESEAFLQIILIYHVAGIMPAHSFAAVTTSGTRKVNWITGLQVMLRYARFFISLKKI